MENTAMLILRLEGPLQSWGERARWDNRDTAAMPTKSGVIGLIAGAYGLKRGDSCIAEIEKRLTMAVRAENPGQIMTDFHTVQGKIMTAKGKLRQKVGATGTIISKRQYIQDASFLIALMGDEELLKSCAKALCDPVWMIYLGRKSCPPTRPVLEKLTHDYSSLTDVMERYPVSERMTIKTPMRCEIEDSVGDVIRRDGLMQAPGRLFAQRRIRYHSVNPAGKETI